MHTEKILIPREVIEHCREFFLIQIVAYLFVLGQHPAGQWNLFLVWYSIIKSIITNVESILYFYATMDAIFTCR